MYNVYLISISYIYLPYLILLFIYALYESTPDYIPIHHVMHVECGSTVCTALLFDLVCTVLLFDLVFLVQWDKICETF